MTKSPLAQKNISPTRVRYIKLGEGGSWEKECLEKGIVRKVARYTQDCFFDALRYLMLRRLEIT